MLLSAYELANAVVNEAAVYRELGESKLVQLAWDYSNAESLRIKTSRARATVIGKGAECPATLADDLERHTIKAHELCEKFSEEYDAYRKRHGLIPGT